jgi:hypothetical protein
VKSQPTETIAVEVCTRQGRRRGRGRAAHARRARRRQGYGVVVRVTSAPTSPSPTYALAFIAARGRTASSGPVPRDAGDAHAWTEAGWWDYAGNGIDPYGWSDVRLAGWMADLTSRRDWRATYRADLRQWCERLRDCNARLAAAARYEALARAALMGDVTEAVPMRRAG